MRPAEASRSTFVVLWRTFFAQFFTSETVGSDFQLRNMMAGVVAFLLVPGVFFTVDLFFEYQAVAIRALALHQPGRITDWLEWMMFVFATYSMATIGFVAVFEWDALGFDRRDAMVLGPLALRERTVVAAKVSALGALLLATSLAVALPNAFVFAFATADQLGAAALGRHFAAHAVASVSAATFVFAAMVAVRGTAGLLAGPRLAAPLGTLFQFAFVAALLGLVILSPYVLRVPHRALVNPEVTGWLPPAWFVGVFEWIRGSPRLFVAALSRRALVALPVALAAALIVSVAGYRRELRRALSPARSHGALGRVRLARAIARRLGGRSAPAHATAEFILLTLARNRAQQALLAVNVAVGLGAVAAGLVTRHGSPSALLVPRTAVLWIPLVLVSAAAAGLRAAFFVPSELPAAWIFDAHGSGDLRDCRRAVLVSTIALLAPAAALMSIALVPIAGWAAALWNALVATAVVGLLAEAMTFTTGLVPFTRAYEAGHARLRTRWPLYVIGLLAFAYLPARLEVRLLGHPAWLASLVASLTALALALHGLGPRLAKGWSPRRSEPRADDLYRTTILDIG